MARRSRGEESRSLGELAEIVGGELIGDAGRVVTGVAEPADAGPSDVVFCSDRKRLPELRSTDAAVALLPAGVDTSDLAPELDVIQVSDPYLAVARVLEALCPYVPVAAGVDEGASVAADAVLGLGVRIAAHAVVGAGARVGAGTEIGPGCVVAAGVVIGPECVLQANVCLYDGTRLGSRVVLHAGVVIGADGFGYARRGTEQVKVPQVGGVVLEDDVEVGANACIDRGTLRDTRIGRGTKIDNLVQIGHNCDIGAQCAISGLAGLSGSTVLEDGVILGGNVGTAGHQVIGAGSMVAAKSGVHGDVEPGSIVGGYPQLDVRVWRRVVAALPKLPEMIRRVRRLERASKPPQE